MKHELLYKIQKNKKSLLLLLLTNIIFTFTINAQQKFLHKIECNFVQYGTNIIQVEPGPNWKGYNINDDVLQLSYIFAKNRPQKIIYGVGLSYMNFKGYNGLNVLLNMENPDRGQKISPLFGSRIGYSKIWNQYPKGKNSIVAQMNTGVRVKLTERVATGFFIGFQIGQQSIIFPIGLNVKF